MIPHFPDHLTKEEATKLAEDLEISSNELQQLHDSKFIVFEYDKYDVFPIGERFGVIDRWYGLHAMGGVSGWASFKQWFREGHSNAKQRTIPEETVRNLSELNSLLEDLQGLRGLYFRGQTRQYHFKRPFTNPLYADSPLGEELIVPGLFRPINETIDDPDSNLYELGVEGWTMMVSYLLLQAYLPKTVSEYEAAFGLDHGVTFKGDPISETISKDTLLVRRHKTLMEQREMLHEGNWIRQLITVLQHYGVPTAAVDVTSDPSVAAFFATHRFIKLADNIANFEFDSTSGSGIIYALRDFPTGTPSEIISNLELFKYLPPTRVFRQNCSLFHVDKNSANRVRCTVVARIHVSPDFSPDGLQSAEYLFPRRAEDPFYDLLLNEAVQSSSKVCDDEPWRQQITQTFPRYTVRYQWADS